jgi:hypothetical protein
VSIYSIIHVIVPPIFYTILSCSLEFAPISNDAVASTPPALQAFGFRSHVDSQPLPIDGVNFCSSVVVDDVPP